jgi:hypothetical protein
MIYQFPHCAVLVAVHRIATMFPDPVEPNDPECARYTSIDVTTDEARMAAAEATVAAHLVSYAMRGCPSPSTYVKGGGDLVTHPLYAKRVEAWYNPHAEDALVVAFVLRARDEPHDATVLEPLVAKVGDLDAFIDRFAWFMLAPNYCNMVKL